MLEYVHTVWRARYFWICLVLNDLRARYRGSVLGMGWSLLNPILMTTVLCVAFAQIFRQEIKIFAPYLFAGLTIWNYITGSVSQGCQCFFQAECYIRQCPVPLAIYPLRTVLAAMFHLLIGLIPVIVLAGLCSDDGWIGPAALLSLIPGLVLLLIFGWSLAVLAGVLNVFFRDTRHLTDIGLQVLFYLTPILYRVDMMSNRRLGLIINANPLVPILRIVRDTILDNRVPTLQMFGSAFLVVSAFAGVATLALWRFERRLIFHL